MNTTRPVALLTDSDGQPLKIAIATRESSIGEHRLKAVFTATTDNGVGVRLPDGEIKAMETPGGGDILLDREWRLEMN